MNGIISIKQWQKKRSRSPCKSTQVNGATASGRPRRATPRAPCHVKPDQYLSPSRWPVSRRPRRDRSPVPSIPMKADHWSAHEHTWIMSRLNTASADVPEVSPVVPGNHLHMSRWWIAWGAKIDPSPSGQSSRVLREAAPPSLVLSRPLTDEPH